MSFEDGKIKAEVAVLAFDPADRGEDRPHKVRLTILSSADFRTPHIVRGRVCPTLGEATAFARQLVAALELLGIPTRDDDGEPGEPGVLKVIGEFGWPGDSAAA